MKDVLCQIKILALNTVKLLKSSRYFNENSSFFSKFIKFKVFSDFLCLNCQIEGYQVKWLPF